MTVRSETWTGLAPDWAWKLYTVVWYRGILHHVWSVTVLGWRFQLTVSHRAYEMGGAK